MEQFTKLSDKLSELFELEKSDLDFGIHRIIKARQDKIRTFLGSDTDTAEPTLRKIVLREMGEANTAELEASLHDVTEKLKDEYGKRAFEGDTLTDLEALGSPEGKQWKELSDQLAADTNEANEQLEAEIYSQLTTFFSRYYDNADFISLRRIKAGATPYAVPYSGEEVMLHWTNKDQYYIKSSKDLKDYTFTLPERFGKLRVHFKCMRQDPVLNNNNAKREFYLDDEAPIEVYSDSLVIPFHFKIAEKTRTKAAKAEFTQEILDAIPLDTEGPSELVAVSKQAHSNWLEALTYTPADAANNLLTRHLNNYTRKNESDFFIHKHLNKFLNQELDFYIKNEVMHLDDIDERSADYLTAEVRKIKAIRTIAKHIITFLAQLENFQKKIWLKKKYVTETNYCFTLDRIFEHAPDLIETVLEGINQPILRHDGLQRSQQEEWIKLYAIDELEDYPADCKITANFLKAHDKLMLDTAFYDLAFTYQLLAALPDIDDSLHGLIINSENFQALNLLQDRYREKVRCVYIDPPYNTDASAIIYKNGYKNSSWSSLIADRSEATRPILKNNGVFVGAIDDVQQREFSYILSDVFKIPNLGTICVRSNPSGRPTKSGYSVSHEYLLFAGKSQDSTIGRLPATKSQAARFNQTDEDGVFEWRNLRREGSNSDRNARRALYYPIYIKDSKIRIPQLKWDESTQEWICEEEPAYGELAVFPDNDEGVEKTWRWEWKKVSSSKSVAVRKDRSGKDYIYYKRRPNKEGVVSVSSWFDAKYSATEHGTALLKKLFPSNVFSYPKSLYAVIDSIYIGGANLQNCLVLDYFAGSGTTAHAVINLNREDEGSRNYILVEMGDHFDTVVKPRIQKVVYSAEWKDAKPQAPETGISHGFKYLHLESYEDALNNLDLGEDRSADLLGLDDSVQEDYLFSYMLDVETRGHLMNLERFRDPWGCQLKIHDPHTGKSEPKNIDLIETFNYLIGITVHELKLKDGFLSIEGENPQGETILILWRKLEGESDWQETTNADLQTHVENTRGLNPADTEYAAIYVNGDHTLDDPQSKISVIEDVFYDRMFAHTGNPDD